MNQKPTTPSLEAADLLAIAFEIEDLQLARDSFARWVFEVEERMPAAGKALAAICAFHLASQNAGPGWPRPDTFEVADLLLRDGEAASDHMAADRDHMVERYDSEKGEQPDYVNRARWAAIELADLITGRRDDVVGVVQDCYESVHLARQMDEAAFREAWWRDFMSGIQARKRARLATRSRLEQQVKP